MGLEQIIKFKYLKEDLVKILSDLNYNAEGEKYYKKSDTYFIEIIIESSGFYIHRSGEYFYELGLLIETLGKITDKIIIEDK